MAIELVSIAQGSHNVDGALQVLSHMESCNQIYEDILPSTTTPNVTRNKN